MRMYAILLFAFALGSSVAYPASGQDAPAPVQLSAEQAETRCKDMSGADLSTLQDAPTHIDSAVAIPAAARLPAFCQVRGYVAPQVGFEIRLPLTSWNGKFLHAGCGGMCGTLYTQSCDSPLKRGYACITSNMGHSGGGDIWALNNLQALVDFGYRATHVATLAGKAITERFYQGPPKRSYYVGCSTGGRQGMVEAQRFPWDFDGLVVGAPVLSHTGGTAGGLWHYFAVTDNAGKPLLSAADAQLTHAGALAACDMDDGIRDGIIGNPQSCRFDPQVLACKPGQSGDCLSSVQIAGVKKVYSGPPGPKGSTTFSRGSLPGSELNMAGPFMSQIGHYSGEALRYTGFMPALPANWEIKDFDFEQDYKRVWLNESLYNAQNPDLRNLKSSGAKLIMYQGWNDWAPLTRNSVDYYETVERAMGGRAATQDFFRLFMIPGMNHCTGGDGAFAVDYLSYLENWVERNSAPDMLTSAHLRDSPATSMSEFPLDPAKVSFTRRVYPYPVRAVFKGKGDPNRAENFRPSR